MSDKERQRVVDVPIWGVFLLFVGIVFLLQTLNVLPWGLWGTLWRFWPALVIIIGLGILLRRYNVWLVSLLILAILGACLGIALWQYGASPPAGVATKSYSEPLGEIKRAHIKVDFSAGCLTMSSLPPGSPNFIELASEGRNRDGSMNVVFHQQDGEGRLSLSTEQANQPSWAEAGTRWEVRLARNIPLTVNIKSAASNLKLDLSELKVTEIRLDLDAGNYKVMMPSSGGTTHAYIEADLANVEVAIPKEVAGKIQVDADLSTFNIGKSRFPKQGDYYISDNFYTAQNKVYLEINSDVGRVDIK